MASACSSCLETSSTSLQGVVSDSGQETSDANFDGESASKHPIHVPPRPAMLEGLDILARQDGRAAFDALVVGSHLAGFEARELALEESYGSGGIWSSIVVGTLKPDLPPLIDPGRWRQIRAKVRAGGAAWRQMSRAMQTCGLESKAFRCRPCGPKTRPVLLPIVCQSRYCRHCSRTKRQRSQARAATVVGRFTSRIRFLTLTIRTQSTLERSTRQLRRALTKLRRRKWWRDHVAGGLLTLESTINRHGFHPHAHLLLDGEFMWQPRMVDEWMSVNGCACHRSRDPHRAAVMCCREKWTDNKGHYETCTDAACQCEGAECGPTGVSIKAMATEAAAVREIAKYAAKELGACQAKGADGQYRDMTAEEVAEFLRNTVGRRLLTTFGTHYDLEAEAAEDQDASQDTGDDAGTGPLPLCATCGASDYQFVGIGPTPTEAREKPPP